MAKTFVVTLIDTRRKGESTPDAEENVIQELRTFLSDTYPYVEAAVRCIDDDEEVEAAR